MAVRVSSTYQRGRCCQLTWRYIDDKNVAKYLEFLKNEDIQSGIGVKIQEKAYFQIEDFFEPFEDDEAAIEREVVAELKQWRKQVRYRHKFHQGCELSLSCPAPSAARDPTRLKSIHSHACRTPLQQTCCSRRQPR